LENKVLQNFCSHLISAEGKSPSTTVTYKLEILCLFRFAKLNDIDAVKIDSSQLSAYLEKRRKQDHIDSRSIAKAISCLRSFFWFLVDNGYRCDNPALIFQAPRRDFKFPRTLSRKKLENHFSHIDTGTPLGIRNLAIYELIYSSGLRVSEASALNIRDVDFKEYVIRVLGKGRKERIAVFGRQASDLIKRYLQEARPLLVKDRALGRESYALFVGRTGKRLSRKGIWKNYARTAVLTGTDSRLHSLRHTFATDMLSGGADLRSVQELLGHADLSTTQIYTHVDTDFLSENHRKYLPHLGEYRENKMNRSMK
jgi:integrase/recombinase XerD